MAAYSTLAFPVSWCASNVKLSESSLAAIWTPPLSVTNHKRGFGTLGFCGEGFGIVGERGGVCAGGFCCANAGTARETIMMTAAA